MKRERDDRGSSFSIMITCTLKKGRKMSWRSTTVGDLTVGSCFCYTSIQTCVCTVVLSYMESLEAIYLNKNYYSCNILPVLVTPFLSLFSYLLLAGRMNATTFHHRNCQTTSLINQKTK